MLLQFGVKNGLLKQKGVLKTFNALGMIKTPDRIDLVPFQMAQWTPGWANAHQQFESLGYQWIGSYNIVPLSYQLMAHYLPGRGAYAVTYEIKGQIITDIYGDLISGGVITVSNPSRDPQTPSRPGTKTIRLLNAPVTALHEAFFREVGSQQLKEATPQNFVPRFVWAYEESVKFLKSH